jgi:hypothetical protein
MDKSKINKILLNITITKMLDLIHAKNNSAVAAKQLSLLGVLSIYEVD